MIIEKIVFVKVGDKLSISPIYEGIGNIYEGASDWLGTEVIEEFELPKKMTKNEFIDWLKNGGREELVKRYYKLVEKYGLRESPEILNVG